MNIEPSVILEMAKNCRRDFVNHTLTNPIRSSEALETMRNELKEKYNELFDKYESIFNLCLSKSYDFSRLEFIVNMASKVHSGDISEHNASVQVGQRLVDEIVKPQLKSSKPN